MRINLLTLVIPLALASCTAYLEKGPGTSYATPSSSNPGFGTPYPQDVQYEILGVGTGEACAELDDLGFTFTAADGGSSAHPALLAEAKYKAIESVPGADNIMFMRAKVVTQTTDQEIERQCVTVTGRTYRVLSISNHPEGQAMKTPHAGRCDAPGCSPDHSAAPSSVPVQSTPSRP